MALYPRARVRLLPESGTQPAITPTQVICHTAVDGERTTSLFDWFANGTNLEAHFYVARDGTVEQYMDTEVRADANNRANGRAISIETWDGRAPDKPANRWEPAQVDALIALIGWLCDTHGIPRVVCPGWDRPGIGWHNQYPEWSPGPTGCPGPLRAAQLADTIIPALSGATVHEEDDMTPEQAALLSAISAAVASIQAMSDATNAAVGRLEVAIRDPQSGIAAQLAGLHAAQIVAAIPDELAQQVADELAKRLQG